MVDAQIGEDLLAARASCLPIETRAGLEDREDVVLDAQLAAHGGFLR